MIPLNPKTHSPLLISLLMLIAPFQAGYVNVGAFHIADGFFVSHVTGTSSMIGMGLGKLNFVTIITFITVLLSFIAGAAFSGYYLKYYTETNKTPKYSLVMFVKFIFFGIVLVLSEFDLFYTSKDVLHISHLLMLFLLSFCCGVQNSSSSFATGGFLKPTHMTGLSTDLGLNLYLFFAKGDVDKEELKKLKKRILILISFILGGTFSELIFSIQGHYGFLFPFISAFIFWFYSQEKFKSLVPSQSILKVTFSLLLFSTVAIGIINFTQNHLN